MRAWARGKNSPRKYSKQFYTVNIADAESAPSLRQVTAHPERPVFASSKVALAFNATDVIFHGWKALYT